jgi:hypothetical protein
MNVTFGALIRLDFLSNIKTCQSTLYDFIYKIKIIWLVKIDQILLIL